MKRSHLIVLPLLLAPLASCVAVAAAAAVGAVGLVQFDRNRAHRDFDVDFETAWTAAVEGAAEMGYLEPVVKEHTPTEGEFEGGEDLWVRVEEHPEGFICVAVRFGTFDTDDHRRRSGLYLNIVARRLGEDPYETGVFEPTN